MILGLEAGNWAEWIGGIGTVLAFAATSMAIWRSHRLHNQEHAEAMYDESLKVTAKAGQGSEYASVTSADGTTEKKAQTKVQVTVHNGGRRQVTNVSVEVIARTGEPVGSSSVEFIQAGWDQSFMFDPIPEVWGQFGSSRGIDALVMLAFEDIDETLWRQDWHGRLLRFPLLIPRWWPRPPGRRHSRHPRSTP